MQVPLLISNRPHKDRCAASVSFYQSLKLVHIFRATVQQALFIQHQHAQAVTCIQQLRCRRMVAGPVCIGAHLFQQAYAIVLQVIRQGAPHTRMVLVVVGSFNLYVFPVQIKTCSCVNVYRSEPKAHLHAINSFTS